MARPFTVNIPEQPPGKLIIKEVHPGYNEVYFRPPKKKLSDNRGHPSIS